MTFALNLGGGSKGLEGGNGGVEGDPVELFVESVQQQCKELLTVMLEERQTKTIQVTSWAMGSQRGSTSVLPPVIRISYRRNP